MGWSTHMTHRQSAVSRGCQAPPFFALFGRLPTPESAAAAAAASMAPLEFNNCDATDEQKLRYAWRRPATKLETPLPHGTPAKPSAPAGKHITKVDLRDQCPPVYNQGKLGSCSANAIGFAYEFDEAPPEGEEKFIPSRLFIYYNERDIEGAIPEDTGAQLIDGIKSVLNTGVCREAIWPYAEDKFDDEPPIWATKPPTECYEE
eukprot:COSAG06_NODE_20473_length_794_cov_1.038849_2_plen_203_part_01